MARSRTLGLVAPSGYLPNPAVIDRAAEVLQPPRAGA